MQHKYEAVSFGGCMGSVIIKASHVGSLSRRGKGYPGPATEEQMELAKRAAVHTKKRWDAEKQQRKKKAISNPHNKTKKIIITAANQPPPELSVSKAAIIPETTRAKQAIKLGISEIELGRRLRAVERYRSEQ